MNRLVKEAKTQITTTNYKTKLENSKNSKESWKTINEITNKQSKCTIIKEIKVNGNTVTGDKNNNFSKSRRKHDY